MRETQFNVLTDYFCVGGRDCTSGLKIEQFTGKPALYSVAAIVEFLHIDGCVTNHDTVNDKRLIDEQTHQCDAYPNFRGGDCPVRPAELIELGVIKIDFRTAQSPASIHPGKIHLHADSGTRPGFDFFLVLRQSRQEQAKQADRNGQQNHDTRHRIGKKFEQAL